MTFYDIFTYLCTFTIIIPLAVFCLFPVIDHLKTPIRHLLIKISLVFVCYFVLLIIPYIIFQQDLGFEEIFEDDGVCVVEWPHYIEEQLPKERLRIEIRRIDEEVRLFIIEGIGKAYEEIERALA